MKFEFVIQFWHVLAATVTITGAFAVNTYMTKQNDKKIKALETKTDGVLTEQEARKIFVSRELYNNQMNHIDETLGELKDQNNKILDYVRK